MPAILFLECRIFLAFRPKIKLAKQSTSFVEVNAKHEYGLQGDTDGGCSLFTIAVFE